MSLMYLLINLDKHFICLRSFTLPRIEFHIEIIVPYRVADVTDTIMPQIINSLAIHIIPYCRILDLLWMRLASVKKTIVVFHTLN